MKHIIKLIVLLFSANLVLGQEIATVENVKIHSQELNQEREILIYTPQGYGENKLVNYNVIYVFDSQNREFFDFTHSIISFLTNATKRYIVVGITSPYIEESDYARNNDLLPEMVTEEAKERYGKYSGNADNFLKYVKNEIVPYMETNYRTLSEKIAVGHSLSASFIIYSLLNEPNLFDDYFAISPNFAFDNKQLEKELLDFNFSNISKKLFIYLSNANEGISYWKEWKPARDKVYKFIESLQDIDNVTFAIKEFPEESHWSTFAPSLSYGLCEYFRYIENREVEFSNESYEITIKVKVPNENDDAYIVGNQEIFGNWNPGLIKMNRISNFEREIKVMVKTPVEFKITRGDWDTEGEVEYMGGFSNISVDPKKQSKFEFNIIEWVDRME